PRRHEFATWSAADGSFEIADLPGGSFTVYAQDLTGEAASAAWSSSQGGPVSLQLVKPGGIDGALIGFSGAVDVQATSDPESPVRSWRSVTTNTTNFKMDDLPSGHYFIAATHGHAQLGVAEVDVAPGRSAPVTVTSRGTATLK